MRGTNVYFAMLEVRWTYNVPYLTREDTNFMSLQHTMRWTENGSAEDIASLWHVVEGNWTNWKMSVSIGSFLLHHWHCHHVYNHRHDRYFLLLFIVSRETKQSSFKICNLMLNVTCDLRLIVCEADTREAQNEINLRGLSVDNQQEHNNDKVSHDTPSLLLLVINSDYTKPHSTQCPLPLP